MMFCTAALLLFLYISFTPKETQRVLEPKGPALPKLMQGPFLRGGLGWLELWCHLDKEARVTFVLEQCPSNEVWSKRKEAKGEKPKVVLHCDDASRSRPASFTVAVYYRGKLLGRASHEDKEKRLLRFCGPSHAPSSKPHFFQGTMYLGEWTRILHAIDLAYPQDYTIVADFTQMGNSNQPLYGQVANGFLERNGTLHAVLTSPHVELLPLPPFAKLKERALSAWQACKMTKERQRQSCLAKKIPAYARSPLLKLISEDKDQLRPRLHGSA